MATTMSTETELVELLNNLIQLDYDAIEAYKAAIARVDVLDDRANLAVFLQDHERHIVDLSVLVQQQGREPAKHGDMMQILTKGKVVLGGLVGDKMVLEAMKLNEDQTNLAYEKALTHSKLTDEVRRVLEQNLSDERRHRAWIERRLGQAEGVVTMQKAG